MNFITVAQPLGFPAPFIALVEDQTKCYGFPTFLYEATSDSAGSHAVLGYSGTSGCGVGYRYDSCNNTQALAVIYPTETVPHPAISFGGTCWGLTGSITDLRPFRTVTALDVSAVLGCSDVTCTGSDATGASVLYMDQEFQIPVTVQFQHLDRGIPLFGVAREAFSTGYNLTPPGQVSYTIWDAPSHAVLTAQEDATVQFTVSPAHIWRDLVYERSGQRYHSAMPPGSTSKMLQLRAGDVVSLEFSHYRTLYRSKSGQVTWEKVVQVPNVYDTALMTFSGSQAITAVGFTGLTNRQDYTFFGTVPADVQVDLPNPNSLVTIQDAVLPEMVLVRAQAAAEERFSFSRPVYAGQKLSSPVMFRFYANRSRSGQHGEMDVWLEQDQSFPAYLRVSPYKALAYGAYSYRKVSQFGDTTRRGLRVVTAGEAALLRTPRVYADDRGERISARASNEYVFAGGQPYVFNGTLDYGISDTVQSGLTELASPSHVRQFSVTGSPRGIAYVPATDEIWAATNTGFAIMAASASPGVTNVAAGSNYAIAWCAATSEVIIARTDGTVMAFDPSTRIMTKAVWIGTTLSYSVYLVVRGSAIYVATNTPAGGATLFALRAQDLATEGIFPTGNAVTVEGLIYVSATGQLLLGTESGGSWLVDPDTGALTNLGLPYTTLWGFCDSPDRRSIFVASAAFPGHIYEVDPVSKATLRDTPTSYSARNPFWHPLRKKVYFGEYVSGYEQIIDANGNALSQVYVGEWSYATAYAPGHRTTFVTVPAIQQVAAIT